MPKVFITKMAINQFLWLFLAAVQSANPFQANPQAAKTKNKAMYLGSFNMFIIAVV